MHPSDSRLSLTGIGEITSIRHDDHPLGFIHYDISARTINGSDCTIRFWLPADSTIATSMRMGDIVEVSGQAAFYLAVVQEHDASNIVTIDLNLCVLEILKPDTLQVLSKGGCDE